MLQDGLLMVICGTLNVVHAAQRTVPARVCARALRDLRPVSTLNHAEQSVRRNQVKLHCVVFSCWHELHFAKPSLCLPGSVVDKWVVPKESDT